MATIKLTLFDSSNNAKHEMELPDSITGDQIIKAMIDRGKLNRTDDSGNPIVYELVAGKREASLGKKITTKSLKDAGVQNGDQLIVRSTIIAA